MTREGRMQNRKIIFAAMILVAFCLSPSLMAEDFYLGSATVGAGDGSNCANARAYTWFNSSSNWGSGAGLIGPGDTVHICGTITVAGGQSGFTFQGGGTSGSPITLVFETGAQLQAPYWATDPGGAIACSGRNYLVIDGGNNGVIAASANGTGLANSSGSNGVFLNSCGNVEVKNLSIQNLYVRTPNSSDSCDCGFGIRTIDASNLSIHDNTIHDAEYGVYYRYDTSAQSASIDHNTIYHTATGIVVGDGSSSATVAGVDLHDNEIYDQYFWDSPGDIFHCDGIHTWATNSGATTSNMRIFNNYIHGDMGGHLSGFIFASAVGGSNDNLQIYNNVLASTTSCATNGYIFIWETGATKIYENTLVGPGGNTCMGIWNDQVPTGSDIKNNIFSGFRTAIYTPSGGGPIGSSDYNLINCTGNLAACMINQDTTYTLAGWRSATGFDVNSLGPSLDPGLNSFRPNAGSPGVDKGTPLGANWAVDKIGVLRPQGAGWDMGAFEFVSGSTVSAPTNLQAVVR